MMFISFHIFLTFLPFATCQSNNACKSYEGYLNLYSSPDCYHISDNYQTIKEIIKKHIGIVEHHNVTTEDGYILGLFRIPRSNPRQVILFHHGFTQDARCWVSQHNESVAFWFWNAGYDVWLSNSRGTFYSQSHVNLSAEQEEFWKFSFDEIGHYDLEALLRYIKLTTNGSKVVLLANSMGFASSLIYASGRTEESNQCVKVIIGLAPVWYLQNSKSLFKWTVFPFMHFMVKSGLHRLLSWYSFPHYDSWLLWWGRTFNAFFPFKKIYIYFVSLFHGWALDELDPRWINLMIDVFGAPTSLKNFDHMYQIITTDGDLRKYDYDKEQNLEVYGVEIPPTYAIEKITVPVFLIYSRDDYLTDPKDFEALYQRLPEKTKTKKTEGFSHHDYFYGKHRFQVIYQPIIEFLKQNDF